MEKIRVPKLQARRRATGTFCYAKFNGREIAFGREGDPETKRAFEKFVGEWIAAGCSIATEEPQSSPGCTVGELLDAYDRHADSYYRHKDRTPTGRIYAVRAALREIRELFSAFPAAEFGLRHLKAVRERMVENGLARVNVNARVAVIRAAFGWAAEEEMVPPAVAAGLKALKHLQAGRSAAKETEPRRPVSKEDVFATLPFLRPRLRALVLAMWHSGMRCGEAVQLRTCDVDMTGATWIFRPPRHKGAWRGKLREIDLGPKAQEALRPWVKLEREAYWFSPADAVRDQLEERRTARATPLWASHQERYRAEAQERARRRAELRRAERVKPKVPREKYDTIAVGQAIARAAERARVPRWSPHQLRHAALSRIRRELGLEAAIACGGHGSPAVTEAYTTSVARELARRAAAELG